MLRYIRAEAEDNPASQEMTPAPVDGLKHWGGYKDIPATRKYVYPNLVSHPFFCLCLRLVQLSLVPFTTPSFAPVHCTYIPLQNR